jgi:predicted transcriptional regulator
MDIASEKAEVLKRFDKVNDLSLIRAIKNMLDFGIGKQELEDEEMEASINRGLEQSLSGETRPHREVMDEFRTKYKL